MFPYFFKSKSMKTSSIKSNMHCYCRVKRDETSNPNIKIITNNLLRLSNNAIKSQTNYFFDKIFSYRSTQNDISQEFEPLLNDVFNGAKLVIFNIGETGSGKTYTQYGPPTNPGLIFRLLQKVVDLSKYSSCKFKMSMVQILEDSCFDLLAATASKLTKNRDVNPFRNQTIKDISNAIELLNILELGKRNRLTDAIYSTDSSVVLTFVVELKEYSEVTKKGIVQFVDFPGIEKINYCIPPNSCQVTLQLFSQMIRDIDSREINLTYNGSMMLEYLKDTVKSNSHIEIIYNIDPSLDHMIETQKTLQFHFDSRKEFNYTHLIEYLEKDNNNYQQLVSTLRLENEMLLRQINTNSRSSIHTENQSVGIMRLSSMDRLNNSNSFIQNTRRVNSVSDYSTLSKSNRYEYMGSKNNQLPSVLEIKESINKEGIRRKIFKPRLTEISETKIQQPYSAQSRSIYGGYKPYGKESSDKPSRIYRQNMNKSKSTVYNKRSTATGKTIPEQSSKIFRRPTSNTADKQLKPQDAFMAQRAASIRRNLPYSSRK